MAKPIKLRKGKKAVLSGGNPRIAKADGDAPVQAYIAAMPGWKRELGKRLDALIVRNVAKVRKAVKWNSPLYGIEDRGWFLGFHSFTKSYPGGELPWLHHPMCSRASGVITPTNEPVWRACFAALQRVASGSTP